MQFKYPGLDVALVTAIWILVPPLGIWIAFTLGYFPWYISAGIVTGLSAIGMWFHIRAAGYVFGSINILLSVVGLLVLFINGFSLWICMRVAFTIFTACVSFAWSRSWQELHKIPLDSAYSVDDEAEPRELDSG